MIHTGLHEGNGCNISDSNPAHVVNLIQKYPSIKFDLFHIGYPYQGLLGSIVQTYPNAYADMCWAHIISPVASVETLYEWLDLMPANKISAFGGDYVSIDLVYGHLKIAKQNVAKSLARKIDDCTMDFDGAKEIGKMVFYDNPKSIFRLP
jgi:predicted TIM-barrel fold metal-dependent hydrolase